MEQRKRGLVSVVVTCWNRQRYIRECLDHLVKQTYPNIEIIVVDDGSKDATHRVIQHWRKRLPRSEQSRVCVVALPRNVGYSGALTTGMFFAKGEFIATHDSDDYSHPDRLRQQVNYLRNHPHIGLVGSNYRVVRDGKVIRTQPNWLAFDWKEVRKRYLRGSHCMTCGSLLFRGSIFDRLGGLNRSMRGAEDYEFVARFTKNGVHATNLPQVLYYVRRHHSQRSRQFY